MSEEEKKAIEYAKEYVENEEVLSVSPFDIKRLLNLIEKQQKEIEELKKPKDNIQVAYGGRRFGTEGIVIKDYISKDIIKRRIKELEEEVKQMEKADIGVGFTLGEEWSNKKATIQAYKELLEE